MQNFKITYEDGSERNVTAKTHNARGDFIIFYNDELEEIHIDKAKNVSSVSREGVADRTSPPVAIA
jgi:hypothetical protein